MTYKKIVWNSKIVYAVNHHNINKNVNYKVFVYIIWKSYILYITFVYLIYKDYDVHLILSQMLVQKEKC